MRERTQSDRARRGRAIRWLLVSSLLALAACQHPFGIGRAIVDGDWIYEAQIVGSSGANCEITGLVMKLEQDGGRFAGVVQGGVLLCSLLGIPVTRSLSGTPITRGRVSGHRVEFELGASGLRHYGVVEGRSMNGTVTAEVDLGDSGSATLEGDFAAARSATE